MIITLLLLVVFTALFGGYTFAFQSATLHWGQVLAGAPTEEELNAAARAQGKDEMYAKGFSMSAALGNRGAQDGITPPIQNFRNLAFPVLAFLVVPLFAGFAVRWWAAPLALLSVFILAGLARRIFPAPSSVYFLRKICAGLKQKEYKFDLRGPAVGAEACRAILERLETHLPE